MPAEAGRASHQAGFHARWRALRNPHVRALAWLLDAPSLLDPSAPEWAGRVEVIEPADEAAAEWLHALDRHPAAFIASLDIQPLTRLGRYAENLLAWYLKARGCLIAQNLQVRVEQGQTLGEFDFLVRWKEQLVHWEFATKLYLLQDAGGASAEDADRFIGPGLADTLGAKISKIMDRQLALAAHPAAAAVLPEPVDAARALVKGWLFYHGREWLQPSLDPVQAAGLAPGHCRGHWCARSEFTLESNRRYALLPRLSWLAPARLPADQILDAPALRQALDARLGPDAAPLLVAMMEEGEDAWLEIARGFVVPDGWNDEADRYLSGRVRARAAAPSSR